MCIRTLLEKNQIKLNSRGVGKGFRLVYLGSGGKIGHGFIHNGGYSSAMHAVEKQWTEDPNCGELIDEIYYSGWHIFESIDDVKKFQMIHGWRETYYKILPVNFRKIVAYGEHTDGNCNVIVAEEIFYPSLTAFVGE